MVISRRSFLRTTGLGATAAALAACSTHGTTTPTPPTTLPATTATSPVPMNYPSLASKLAGHLVTPADAGYEEARRSYNPLFDGRRPAVVAQCVRTSDVQACVELAAATRTPIAARAGGHSYAGFSTPDNALVVDLAGMSGVQVDGDTAVIGAGARLIDVYTALAAAGRCLPAGSCPSVGIAGLTLGGGIGVLARKYGLTCDSLTGATVVTADGTARAVSASDDADLFWALRGGGGGNFGIVTSFTFHTVPAPPQFTVFLLGYHAVADAFAAWQPWIAAAPDELWANFNVTGGSPPTCTVAGCYVGTSAALNPLLDKLTSSVTPTYRNVQTLGYLDAMRHWAGPPKPRESFVASSRMLAAPLGDPATIADAATGHPNLHLIIDGLGGAVGRIGAADTAFAHRTAVASVQIYLKTTPAAQADAARQVYSVRDRLTPAVGDGAYVNYLDQTMPNWAQAYYGANLPRLRTVARTYDPNQVFTFAQAVDRA